MKSFNFDKIDVTSLYCISNEFLNDIKANVCNNLIHDDIILSIKGWAAGLKDEMIILSVEYPDGWWQHFKHSVFPNWLKKKFPVRMKTVVREEQKYSAVCPHNLQLSLPDHHRHLMWLHDTVAKEKNG